ncbi:MAG: TonB-dependent receptor [Nitrospirae bacterium]|nr:TonB-dependent receptor [Nitrospirota bacterium]
MPRLSRLLPLFCLAAAIALFSAPPPSSAADMNEAAEKELAMLSMFFDPDELVITATRSPKPLSQVAENMTIINSREIEEMRAHTVAEVLNRATGVFVGFFGQDFGSDASLSIQGSNSRHVLLLVDGIPWNMLVEGSATPQDIPVGIIERIEIVKGPASSTWGSALGGVINIITKDTKKIGQPPVSLFASYGGGNSRDLRAEARGRSGPIGFYIHAEHQASDGLVAGRSYDAANVTGKLSFKLGESTTLKIASSYSEPRHGYVLDFTGLEVSTNDRNFFASAVVDSEISDTLSAYLMTFQRKLKYDSTNNELGGVLYNRSQSDDTTNGVRSNVTYRGDFQTITVGADYEKGKLDNLQTYGPTIQGWGAPAAMRKIVDAERWAVFANDNILAGQFTIIPGVRYDHHEIAGDFTSPSLGATWRAGENTILRATVSKGFTSPAYAELLAGGLFLDPNPNIKPEETVSYQAGVETLLANSVRLKALFFNHRISDVQKKAYYAGGPSGCVGSACNDIFVNAGSEHRRGLEIDAETSPVKGFSFKAGGAFVDIDPNGDDASKKKYRYTAGLHYDDMDTIKANVTGQYVWHDAPAGDGAEYNAVIVDAGASKTVLLSPRAKPEFFMVVHNLFNGSSYWHTDYKNPRRWIEGGVKLLF